MSIVLALGGHHGTPKQTLLFERRQHLMVALPGNHPRIRDLPRLLQLRPEKCRGGVAWQERRTEVLPGVFVDFAAKKSAAVGALLADDFSARGQRRIADQKAAAFTRNDVLGFVKTKRAEIANRPERAALVGRHDT